MTVEKVCNKLHSRAGDFSEKGILLLFASLADPVRCKTLRGECIVGRLEGAFPFFRGLPRRRRDQQVAQ